MTFRSIVAGLIGLALAGSSPPVQAQTKGAPKPGAAKNQPRAKEAAKPSTKELLQQAFKQANDNPTAAIGLIDQALKQSPDDRQALYVLSVLASMGAEQAKTDTAKVAMLRRATGAYQRLQEKYKPLEPNEQGVAELIRLDEVRILALEGKTAAALDGLAQMIAEGFSNLDALDQFTELKAVRSLPDYAAKMAKANEAGVRAAIAATESFPFDFALQSVDDKAIKLADYRGKVTIVDVWGTWCPPCRQEIPHFVDLAAKYEKQGLKIVGINCNEQGSPAEVKKTIKQFIAENKISYPCVLNDDKTEEKIPGFQGYPTTLFLDGTGKVRLVLVGYTPLPRLEAIVTTLLGEAGK